MKDCQMCIVDKLLDRLMGDPGAKWEEEQKRFEHFYQDCYYHMGKNEFQKAMEGLDPNIIKRLQWRHKRDWPLYYET
jgi:hypothetical protein